MYKLKVVPEDFIVNEISNVELKDSGNYLYFKLTKKNWNTLDVVKKLAKVLRLRERKIGFAGSKDKQAITSQVVSVYERSREKVLAVKIEGVTLEYLGVGDKPVSLGDLSGNSFEIVVRDLEGSLKKVKFMPNYFDEQRFSTNNVEIGKHLIKKEFSKAVALIDNVEVKISLERKKNDFVGALQKLPLRFIKMYVHAYQSWLWNETLSSYLKQNGRISHEVKYSMGKLTFVEEKIDVKIPLIGFDSSLIERNKIILALMDKEEITCKDFIIKQIPDLSLEGEFRDTFVEIKDLNIEGNKISFTLPKGSYATMVVKALII